MSPSRKATQQRQLKEGLIYKLMYIEKNIYQKIGGSRQSTMQSTP